MTLSYMNLAEALVHGAETHGQISIHQDEEIAAAQSHIKNAIGPDLLDEIAPEWEGITEWFRQTGELTKLILQVDQSAKLEAFMLVYRRKFATQAEFRLFIATSEAVIEQDLSGLKCIDITNGMLHAPTRDRVCAFLHSVQR